MPGVGIPQGPPLAFGDVSFLWSVIALAMLAGLAAVLWIRRARNGVGTGAPRDGHDGKRSTRPRIAA